MTYLLVFYIIFLPESMTWCYGTKWRRRSHEEFLYEIREISDEIERRWSRSRPQVWNSRRAPVKPELGSQNWQFWPVRNEPARIRPYRAIKASVWLKYRKETLERVSFSILLFLHFLYPLISPISIHLYFHNREFCS